MSDKPEEKILPQEMPDNHYTKMFDECYNLGIERCIEVVKGYYAVDMYLSDTIVDELEKLKKPCQ